MEGHYERGGRMIDITWALLAISSDSNDMSFSADLISMLITVPSGALMIQQQ